MEREEINYGGKGCDGLISRGKKVVEAWGRKATLVQVYGVRVSPTRFVEFDPTGFPRVACFDNVCHVADHPRMGCVMDSDLWHQVYTIAFEHTRECTI